jgi:hypothetical protein
MNKISSLLCLGLVTCYSFFSIEVRTFFKWLHSHTSGWSAAVMVLRVRDRFENILLMNDRFHRVTKYVKRFSVFAYSRMFAGWVQTSTRPLIYQWYMAIHQELSSQKFPEVYNTNTQPWLCTLQDQSWQVSMNCRKELHAKIFCWTLAC